MMRSRWYFNLMLSLVLLLAGMALGCETKTPPPTEVPVVDKCLAASKAGRGKQEIHPEYKDLMYIEGQVIVSGNPAQIGAVTEELSQTYKLALPLLEEFPLSDGMAIQLYEIPENQTPEYEWVEWVTCEINQRGKGLGVVADPNYHLSPAGWAGGGSPWTQNGDWAEGLPGGGLGEAPGADFRTQWAFGSAGIHLFDSAGDHRTVPEYMGQGVRIGVFDSSPFPDQGETLAISLSITQTVTVTKSEKSFQKLMGDNNVEPSEAGDDLTVWHFDLIEAPTCPGNDLEDRDISNHGLFVAGLAHTVAPASEIYLVRVLENDGCGDLFSISQGIELFMHEMLKGNKSEPIVINLSLGVHQPPEPTTLGLPSEVVSLQRTVQNAIDHGAVVVAAAGNDSYDKLVPSEMEIPASDRRVIGVAASNSERGRGCFSNEGDVAAPGGNGFEGAEDRCEVPDMNSCQQFDLCLIGPIYKPYKNEPQYAYWVGTSFAAPLVSGLTALTIEREGIQVIGPDVASTIEAKVTEGACSPAESPDYLGAGIINLPHTLYDDHLCPTPMP